MGDSCNSCAAKGTCSSGTCPSEPEITEAQKASRVGKLIAVMSGKGGVGKSSVTGMLAVSLQSRGYKVGVLDADVTGPSIPRIFGVSSHAAVTEIGVVPPHSGGGIKLMSLNLMLEREDDPVIWRGPVIAQLVTQFWKDVVWGELDYLLVDLPPGTGDVPITIFQSLPVDGVVIVTSPQQLAGMIVRKAINMAKKYEAKIYGLVENLAYVECPDCHRRLEVFGTPRGAEEARRSEIPFLGTLPIDPQLSAMADAGKIEQYRSEMFDRIAERLVRQIADGMAH